MHPIPANASKGEPDHRHVDFRFLFTATAEALRPQAEEVTDAAWCPLEAIAHERLRARIAEHPHDMSLALSPSR